MNSTQKELFLLDELSEMGEKQYLSPEEYGWTINEDGLYDFKWFDGPQLPEKVKDIVIESDGESYFIIISFTSLYATSLTKFFFQLKQI